MNDNHSMSKLKYKARWIAPVLREAVNSHPVVVLTGARQVGKSTLLKCESPFSEWRYVNLDDFDTLAQARSDPSSLWVGTGHVVIDEVQRAPGLITAIKKAVDEEYDQRRYVLSGSANILLMKEISESLAGRAVYISLYPMTYGELQDLPAPKILESLFAGELPVERCLRNTVDLYHLMWKGFMPSLLRQTTTAGILRWFEGYISTYLERDLRQLSQIDALPDFRRLMMVLALRCGSVLNQTEAARDTGLSQPTAHRYINLLETTCLVERLPAFSVNRTKRLVKSPKVVWNDTGLATFLAGHYSPAALKQSRESGGIFEAMIYLHLNSLLQQLMPRPYLYYWRTTTGKEVDFIIEWGTKLLAVEVKLSDKPRYEDTGTLRLFMNEYPQTVAGILVHGGQEIKIMHERIVAVPWTLLAGYA